MIAFFATFLYLGLVLIRPQDYLLEWQDTPLLSSLMVSAFLIWGFAGHKNLELPQYKLIVGILLGVVVSVLMTGWLGGAVEAFWQFVPAVILFILVSQTVVTKPRMNAVLRLYVLASLVMVAHGIDQIQTGVGWTGETLIAGRIRYVGIFNDPNDLAMLFVTAVPLAMFLRRIAGGQFRRLFWLLSVGFLLYGVYLTNSRGGMVSAIIVLALLSLRKVGVFWLSVFGALTLPILAASTRLSQLDEDKGSALGRVDAWIEGFAMFKQSPITGIGFNNFMDYHGQTAHNSFILVIAELGIFGYFFWFTFCALTCILMYKLIIVYEKQQAEKYEGEAVIESDDGELGRVLLICLIGFLSAAFFISRSYNSLLYILCGLSIAHYKMMQERAGAILPKGMIFSIQRWIGVCLLSVFVIYLFTKVAALVL